MGRACASFGPLPRPLIPRPDFLHSMKGSVGCWFDRRPHALGRVSELCPGPRSYECVRGGRACGRGNGPRGTAYGWRSFTRTSLLWRNVGVSGNRSRYGIEVLRKSGAMKRTVLRTLLVEVSNDFSRYE